jgi:Flp pilus assembly protein TadG
MRRFARHLATADRGAAAVEFAIVLTLLLTIVFGIIDFGRAYNAQMTLTQAAREGARLDALASSTGMTPSDVELRAGNTATGLGSPPANAQYCAAGAQGPCVSHQVCPARAPAGSDAKVTVTYKYTFVTPLLALIGRAAGAVTLTGVGVLPCAG